MNIIFNNEHVDSLQNNNILLELDTFYLTRLDKTVTAYCVIDNIGINDIVNIEHVQKLHNTLMSAFKSKNFALCQDIIPQLIGSFGGEVDTFYNELSTRVQSLLDTTQLPSDWTNIIERCD